MDISVIKAEISAQSNLVGSILLNSGLVSDIDRHIKNMERTLNEKLVMIDAGFFILHYLPPAYSAHTAREVDENSWNNISFTHVFHSHRGLHEEIAYEKSTKGFAFFYIRGYVTYDIGIIQEHGGVDIYIRIIKDERKRYRVTGAPVEIKLRSFEYLRRLVQVIYDKANGVAKEYQNFAFKPMY